MDTSAVDGRLNHDFVIVGFTLESFSSGNFLNALTTNILLSGNNFTNVALLFWFMQLGMVSCAQFDRIQSLYAVPAVMEYWEYWEYMEYYEQPPSSNYRAELSFLQVFGGMKHLASFIVVVS